MMDWTQEAILPYIVFVGGRLNGERVSGHVHSPALTDHDVDGDGRRRHFDAITSWMDGGVKRRA